MSHLQPVIDETQVAEARRTAAALTSQARFSEEAASSAAIVVTELATNLAKHAGGGKLLFRELQDSSGERGLEILSLDTGPGMANIQVCLRDGYSTGGTAGNGLGAIRRLSRVFDVFSRPGQGTAILSEVWQNARTPCRLPARFEVGGVNVPIRGEHVCGDCWALNEGPGTVSLLVADGLGHGLLAAEASLAAAAMFRQTINCTAREQISAIHDALRSTRGAAGAIACITPAHATLTFCGIGNIAGVIVDDAGPRHLVSHNGTLGHDAKTHRDFVYPWNSSCLLIMLSDGIATKWMLSSYPGLQTHRPALIAGVLFRDFSRGRDDATVVVLREGGK